MLSNLRKQFVIITMSLLAAVILLLFFISNHYDRYWDYYDTYRIVKIVAKNGYVKDYSDEAIAMVTVREDGEAAIIVNETELADKAVKEVSRSLLKRNKKGWKWRHYVYSLQEKKEGVWQLAFIDLNSYSSSSEQLLLTALFTVFDFLLLTGVSIYLSRFIIQPAKDAIDREKQFVSDASHELKTPIAAIRANAQVLQNQIEPNRYLDHILSETKRMEHLVQDLLGLSKLDETKQTANFTRVDLSKICEEMILSYESLAYEEGKLIDSQITDGVWILGEESQLKQLITILLDNAIQYSLANSTIHISLAQVKKTAVLQVSNPSQIYSKEVMDNLFERFYQAEGSRHSTSSFGLGLAIAKGIVKHHQGQVRAWQDKGEMILEVRLPITQGVN
ncbi:sensor histidine kinase [Streptococcus caviae]|uniref:sensor histidine kinase n=1 Tax=Streptococcus sp. 'caviae' TaxID=1915004 RepID=UPI00094BB4F7|nr:HAMP domain-containing sensor histidine kinase [Streptococcus sp. 'caviae']OLN83771.1 two-component sensor histidine kinase [Streptococcus sp. 'caviae']